VCRSFLDTAQYIKPVAKGSFGYAVVPGAVPSIPFHETDSDDFGLMTDIDDERDVAIALMTAVYARAMAEDGDHTMDRDTMKKYALMAIVTGVFYACCKIVTN
jgi:hypothetical protein